MMVFFQACRVDGVVTCCLCVVVVVVAVLLLRARGSGKPVVQQEDAPKSEPAVPTVDAAYQLLGLLQQEARFIDFAQEDLKGFSDAEIGAVARVVHEGSQKVLGQYFTLAPVSNAEEESAVTVPEGFNPAQFRLTGNVVGQAPFKGPWSIAAGRCPIAVYRHWPKAMMLL